MSFRIPWRSRRTGRNPPIGDVDAGHEGPYGRPGSVRLLLRFAQELVLKDEDERQRHLDTKGGTLAGFVAVALSLEAGLGASVLIGEDISCPAEVLFTSFFVVAVISLAASALCAVLGVLVPQGYLAVDEPTVRELAAEPMMQVPAAELRERLLATVVEITLQGRERNRRKARFLTASAIFLGLGVTAIAAQGLTLPFA